MAREGLAHESVREHSIYRVARRIAASLGLVGVLLLLVLASALIVGFHYKALSDPPILLPSPVPQSVWVATSDPQAHVSLTARYTLIPPMKHPKGPRLRSPLDSRVWMSEALLLSVQPPPGKRDVRWLVWLDADGAITGHRATLVYGDASEPSRVVYYTGTASALRSHNQLRFLTADGYAIGGAALANQGVVQSSRGTVAVQLPLLGSGEWFAQERPFLLEQRRGSAVIMEDPALRKHFEIGALPPHDPRQYQGVSSDMAAAAFFTPHHLSTTAVLVNFGVIQDSFENYHFDSVNPSTYVLSGDELRWHGSFDLEPRFVATDTSAGQARANDAFYAGISFGLVGAAGIALLQELSEGVRRLRESRREDATPE